MQQMSWHEDERDIPVLDEVDVLIAGGGPSGVAAAIGAARTGAKTMLVESYGFLGGMWTAGLVLTLAGFNSWLSPYQRCVDGVAGLWLREAVAQGFAEDNAGWVLNSEPEGMKLVADQIVLDAGVEILFHTRVTAPIVKDGIVGGVIVENLDGRSAILAKVVVDCTGNGEVYARAGAGFEKSDQMQPLTLAFDIGNIEADPLVSHTEPRCLPIGPEPTEITGKVLRENASRRLDIHFDYQKFNQDYKKGLLPLFGGPWTGGIWKDVAWMNTVRVIADGSDAKDKTRAEIEGRRNAFALARYYFEHVPGFEHGRIQRLAAEIGVRETRRLKGLYVLSGEDIKNSRRFDDVIGLGCWAIDVHPRTAAANHSLFAPLPFDIPYRILVPESLEGLLVAGRSVSCDREALASIRVGATCGVTGHAAGVAAGLCVRLGVSPREMDVRRLQQTLLEQHAILHV
ncbi:MAG: FAD-dependent oxidoreductase [Spirochaetae bacterium HGW-Spirochaetae-8]|nr:MAG: FAD-dependent oxidoreductase [Spirochaetae bacterium HGW-Spirochaetae-8]